jgi:CRP-like cAMP-binding protein
LKFCDIDIFHDLLFSFKQETFEKGSLIFKKGEKSNAMFIVKTGIIEITSEIE